MKTKIISLFLCLCLTIGMCIVPAYAVQYESPESSIELLGVLNLLEYDQFGNFPAEIFATRAQFCGLVARAAGLKTSLGFSSVFSDVTEDTDNAMEILALYESGVINGGNTGKFRPNDYILRNEAIKIAVSVLGYEIRAEATGGYPVGYVNLAKQLGLLDNVPVDRQMTNGAIAQLVRNMIEAPTCEVTSLTKENYTISNTGESLLFLQHDVKKISDVFNSDKFSSLVSPGEVNEDTVTIGEEVFSCDFDNKHDYLGYFVNGYYDATSKKLIYCEIDDKNDGLVISSDEEPSYNRGSLSYRDKNSNKKRSVSIPSNAHIIYNGKNITQFSEDIFSVKTGNIELVDNNRDGKWNVVKIYDYKTYIVDSLDYDNKKFYVKNSANPVISLDGVECEFYEGTEKLVDYSYITPWSVVSVLISDDGKVMRFYKSSEKIDMSIKLISEDYVTGDNGKNYKVHHEYETYFDKLKLGEKETYLLDVFGNICGKLTGLRTRGELAYMLGTEYERIDKSACFLVVSENSTDKEKEIILKSNKKIMVDGEKLKPEDAVDAIEDLLSSSTEKLVMLFYDNEGNVSKIDTLNMGVKEDRNNSLCLDYSEPAGESGTGLLYREQGGTFAGKTLMANGFKIFYVPPHEQGEQPDVNGMAVRDLRSLATGEKYNDFSTYKIGVDNFECIAMIRNLSATERIGTYDRDMSLTLIDGFHRERNPETDEFENKVEYYYKGVKEEAFVTDEAIADELNSGDIVKLSFDADGKINDYKKVFDAETYTITTDYTSDNFDYIARAQLVNVYAVRDGVVLVTKETPSSLEAIAVTSLEQKGEEATTENIMLEIYNLCEKHRLPESIGEYDMSQAREERYSTAGELSIRSFEDYGSDYSQMLIYTVYSTVRDAYILSNFN